MELFKCGSKEAALKEIDNRLKEAMRPPKQEGNRLLEKVKQLASTRKQTAVQEA